MVKDEFRPDVGKKIFLPHQSELEQGLRKVAHALGRDSEFNGSADFFRAFISGFWDPYEEVCKEGNYQQEEITAEIRALETQLFQALGPDGRSLLERYGDLLAERNSTVLDYAFLVGYQCAFRFLMMGLFPATGAFFREEAS